MQVVLTGPDVSTVIPNVSRYGSSESRRTDDLGRFRFPDLGPGGYVLTVHRPETPRVDAEFDLPAGQALVERDIVVGAGRTLAVRVVDGQARPVPRAMVSLAHVGAAVAGGETSMQTDADGIAKFSELPRRLQSIAIAPPGSALLPSDWRDVPDDAGDLTIVLRAARNLTVRLLDPSGQQVAAASLRIIGPDESEWWGVTDRSGATTMLIPSEGTRIEFPGVVNGVETGWSARCDAIPESGDVTLRCETVRRDRTLRVRVVTPDGEPISGARVSASHRMWSTAPEAVGDAAGIAVLKGLPERELRVTATNVGNWVVPARLTVTPADQEVVLRARRGVAVRGTLVRPGGEAVEGWVRARVRVGGAEGDYEELTSRKSDPDGRFTLLVPEGVAGPFHLFAHTEIRGLDIYGYAFDVQVGDDVRISLRPAVGR